MGRAGAARSIGGMRGLAFALVGLAILLRISIPAGWMPSSGTIGITMCTGYGTVRVAMAVPGQHDGKAEAAAREHPCAFCRPCRPVGRARRSAVRAAGHPGRRPLRRNGLRRRDRPRSGRTAAPADRATRQPLTVTPPAPSSARL